MNRIHKQYTSLRTEPLASSYSMLCIALPHPNITNKIHFHLVGVRSIPKTNHQISSLYVKKSKPWLGSEPFIARVVSTQPRIHALVGLVAGSAININRYLV